MPAEYGPWQTVYGLFRRTHHGSRDPFRSPRPTRRSSRRTAIFQNTA
ncbi:MULTISPECIES: hypothetical protein [unclassified Streptomyces]|nr:hypothetical protein [Streptomyces sp. NBC_01751]